MLISHGNPTADSFEGVVVDYATRWLRIALPNSTAGHVRGPGWRLDLFANTVAHERSCLALSRFAAPATGGSGSDHDAIATRAATAGGGDDGGSDLWRVLSGAISAGEFAYR